MYKKIFFFYNRRQTAAFKGKSGMCMCEEQSSTPTPYSHLARTWDSISCLPRNAYPTQGTGYQLTQRLLVLKKKIVAYFNFVKISLSFLKLFLLYYSIKCALLLCFLILKKWHKKEHRLVRDKKRTEGVTKIILYLFSRQTFPHPINFKIWKFEHLFQPIYFLNK